MTATNTWQDHLTAQGASLQNGAITHFGDAKAELAATLYSNIICDLNHLALLEISGADAETFLQGQVTNDIKLLNGTNAHYSAYCNPKGRMLALFLAFLQADKLYLQLPRSLIEPIAKRLKMYVMRSKVDIKEAAEIITFGINGPQAASILAASLAKTPSADYELLTLDNASVLKLPSLAGHARFQIFANAQNAAHIWDTLKTKAKPVGKACWDYLEIQTGLPEIVPATQEQFVPQMLNLDVLNGINFKKGCYTGQEIVARTHYLGKVKRRTFLASVATNLTPAAGDVLLDNNGQEAGQIVRVAPNTTDGFELLAELRLEAVEAGNVFWQDVQLNLKSLPYMLAK